MDAGEEAWFQEQLRSTEKTQAMVRHYQKFRAAVQLGTVKNDKYQMAVLKESMTSKTEVEIDVKGEMMTETRWMFWATSDPANSEKLSIPEAQASWADWAKDPAKSGMITDLKGPTFVRRNVVKSQLLPS